MTPTTANNETPPLMTMRDAARRIGVATHRLRYAIDEHAIEPKQRAGIIRLYGPDQLPAMKSALRRIAERRTNG